MYSKSKYCIEHPLGILCKCAEYQSMIEKLISYNIGTWNQLLPKVNIEPIASAEVSWINNHTKVDEDITKPIIMYPREKSSINARNVDRIWIPVSEDAVSLKSMRISWKLWK
ncbi:uncharacterized protein LOC143216055 [Lasioglossum baleicum]|uniref:uncharacterized protein LOC143216055 n=1 Tax=Lasioglossum baleicum TaxID=434251 RepID=UPI003FCC6E69